MRVSSDGPLSPLRGSFSGRHLGPTADAVGCILTPLRGFA